MAEQEDHDATHEQKRQKLAATLDAVRHEMLQQMDEEGGEMEQAGAVIMSLVDSGILSDSDDDDDKRRRQWGGSLPGKEKTRIVILVQLMRCLSITTSVTTVSMTRLILSGDSGCLILSIITSMIVSLVTVSSRKSLMLQRKKVYSHFAVLLPVYGFWLRVRLVIRKMSTYNSRKLGCAIASRICAYSQMVHKFGKENLNHCPTMEEKKCLLRINHADETSQGCLLLGTASILFGRIVQCVSQANTKPRWRQEDVNP